LINLYIKYNDTNNFIKTYPHLYYLRSLGFLENDYENIIKNPILFREKYLELGIR